MFRMAARIADLISEAQTSSLTFFDRQDFFPLRAQNCPQFAPLPQHTSRLLELLQEFDTVAYHLKQSIMGSMPERNHGLTQSQQDVRPRPPLLPQCPIPFTNTLPAPREVPHRNRPRGGRNHGTQPSLLPPYPHSSHLPHLEKRNSTPTRIHRPHRLRELHLPRRLRRPRLLHVQQILRGVPRG